MTIIIIIIVIIIITIVIIIIIIYEELGLTAQNLQDQAARTEKTLGNVTRKMAGNFGTRNGPVDK